ncbi:MAG TPA: SBBP repeat-containing protein, partial [Bryobacteraceae bacterium]|nr:SBBP repeat-containing protein [Bryobacteraceae bacterium]
GADPSPVLEARDRMPGVSNYLTGKDARHWRRGIPHFAQVRYREVYPGISMLFHGNPAGLEYDFEVRPGADPRRIRIAFPGAGDVSIDDSGDLRIGSIRQRKAVAYQERGGSRVPVDARYRLVALETVALELGRYDAKLPLIIDPTIVFSNNFPGMNIAAMAVGTDGAVYVAGSSTGSLKVTAGAVQSDARGGICGDLRVLPGTHSYTTCNDAFVAKLDSGGTLLYATYLGGGSEDRALGLAVDSAGSAYLTGATYSKDFPVTAGAIQKTYGGPEPVAGWPPLTATSGDAFVVKLDPAGTSLAYSTFLGGSATDTAQAIQVDALGNAYVAGSTRSFDFPPAGGATPVGSAFLCKINTAGTEVVTASLLPNAISAMAVDPNGAVWLTGTAVASVQPTTSAFQTAAGGRTDAYVTKLAADGKTALFTSYLGGNGNDTTSAIALDSQGNAWVTGTTDSTDFPPQAGGGAFAVKISHDGTALLASQSFGHSLSYASTVAVDSADNVYLSGSVSTDAFTPTPDAILAVPPSSSPAPFAAQLNAQGTTLFASYLTSTPTALAAATVPARFYTAGGNNVAEINLTAAAAPVIAAIVNAASFYPSQGVAAGEILTLYGSGLGPQEGIGGEFDASGHLPTTLGETTVYFGGVPCPLLYVQDRQVNVIAPVDLQPGATTAIVLRASAGWSLTTEMPVVAADPGIFILDGKSAGQGAILNEDGTVNSTSNPARVGSVIQIFGTGFGQTVPLGTNGVLVDGTPHFVAPVAVQFGFMQAEVLYAGAAPGLVTGGAQLNVRIPETTLNLLPIYVRTGTMTSQMLATVAVR